MNEQRVSFLLCSLNGTLWEKSTLTHIYFPTKALCDLYGLTCRTYASGRVCTASLHGEKITNSRATRIITMFQFGKFHYDCGSDEFTSRTMPKAIINKIKKLILEREKSI